MVMKFQVNLVVAFIVCCSSFFISSAFAQAVDLADLIETMAKERKATTDKIEELSEAIDVETIKIEEANDAVDELIAQLREQADIGNPDGTFIQRLENLEKLALADAEAAKIAGYADFEEEFLEDASVFNEQKSTLINEWESLDRRIRAVENERKRIVFVIKLRRYDEIQKLYDEATNVLRKGEERLAEVEDELKKTNDKEAVED